MESREYELMYRAEDQHWWYRGLRAMIDAAWVGHVDKRQPDVLDIGCGTGALMTHLSGRGWVTGLDFSSNALNFCRGRGLPRLLRADAAALPVGDASFDVAVSCDVIYHQAVADPLCVLREAKRALRPGGVLVLNVPAYSWLRSSHDIGIHTARRFTRGQVVALLREAGFDEVHATYWNTLLFPVAMALRLWRRLVGTHTEESDLADVPSPFLNRVMGAILGAERKLLRLGSMPFGLSIFVVARKR